MLLLGAGMVAAPLVEHLGRLDNLTVKLTIGIIRPAFIPTHYPLISNDLYGPRIQLVAPLLPLTANS